MLVAALLYKWLMISLLNAGLATGITTGFQTASSNHPFFISVTQITHNKDQKAFEITCKIFADDFEQALKQAYKKTIDFSSNANELENNKIINIYIQKHLSVSVDARLNVLQYEGMKR